MRVRSGEDVGEGWMGGQANKGLLKSRGMLAAFLILRKTFRVMLSCK